MSILYVLDSITAQLVEATKLLNSAKSLALVSHLYCSAKLPYHIAFSVGTVSKKTEILKKGLKISLKLMKLNLIFAD